MKIFYDYTTWLFLTTLNFKLFISATSQSDKKIQVSLRHCESLTNRNAIQESSVASGLPNSQPKPTFLPRELFPFLLEHISSVEVTFNYNRRPQYCPEGERETTTIDFSKKLQLFRYGENKYFQNVSFTDEHTLYLGGKLFNRVEFCVSSTTSMKSLTIQTCTRECSRKKPCVQRCCGGQQGIPKYPSRSEKDAGFSCHPALGESDGKVWTPFQSNIIGLSKNSIHFSSTDFTKFKSKDCKLLQLKESIVARNTLEIMKNGMLLLHIGNKSDVVEIFCIDGVICKNETSSICNASGEVMYVYACDMDETKLLSSAPPEKTKDENALNNYDSIDTKPLFLPGCSDTFKDGPSFVYLPYWFFADKNKTSLVPGLVRLNKASNLECPHGHDINTFDFAFGKEATKRRAVFNNENLRMGGLIFQFDEFCIDSFFHNSISIRTCKKICNKEFPCITRCCDGSKHVNLQHFLDNRALRCDLPTAAYVKWNPVLFRNVEDTTGSTPNETRITFYSTDLTQTRSSCRHYTSNPEESHFRVLKAAPSRFLESGKLMLKSSQKFWTEVHVNDYCIEPFLRQSNDGTLKYTGHPDDTLVRICSKISKRTGYVDNAPKLIASLFFIFSLFYGTTALIYIMRTDKDLVFRWSIIFCCFSMTLSYVALGYSRISYLFHRTQSHYLTTCALIGMFTNFIFLSGFSWTTTISFDIWHSLTFLSPKKKSKERIWWYGLFAFGVPGIIVGTGVALDVIHPNPLFTNIVAPAYGRSRCFFRADEAPFVYFYGPLSILISGNLFFFSGAVFQLWKASRSVVNQKSDNNSTKAFLLNLKLFLLMGIPWVLDILSWLAIELDKPQPLWTVAVDIITIIQPAFVFMLLIWNKDNKKYFGAKYPWAKSNVAVNYVDTIGKNLKLLVTSCFCFKYGEETDVNSKDRSSNTCETPESILQGQHKHT